MIRTLPPSAAPVPFRMLMRSVGAAVSGNGADGRFRHRLRAYFGTSNAFLVSSGKAALYLSLLSLRKISRRTEVIIPAYASYCLASAVARSGLQVRLCDIDSTTLDFDLSRLRSLMNEQTLVVVPVHNYGLVCDMEKIIRLAAEAGARVVEDAAQAAGASLQGRKTGTIGDIGILSLGRGKNICALGGGVILTQQDLLANALSETIEEHGQKPARSAVTGLLQGIALSLFLDPERYAIPSSLPFLRLGANIFDPDFEVGPLPALHAALGDQIFPRLDRYNGMRIRNAQDLKNSLTPFAMLRIPEPNPRGRSVYLRLPVLFPDRATRDMALRLSERRRLGASCSYPLSLDQVAPFRRYVTGGGDFPEARLAADRILTLPTHPMVTPTDISRLVKTLHDATCSRMR